MKHKISEAFYINFRFFLLIKRVQFLVSVLLVSTNFERKNGSTYFNRNERTDGMGGEKGSKALAIFVVREKVNNTASISVGGDGMRRGRAKANGKSNGSRKMRSKREQRGAK